MNMQRLPFTVAMALICTVSVFAQDVNTHYDRAADFNKYKTYSWTKVQTDDVLWGGHTKEAVNSALAAKGWNEVETGGDVTIIAMEMTKKRNTLDTYYGDFQGGWGWRWGGGFPDAPTTEDTYRIGTLVVDMFDSNSKKLIWRSSASEALSSKSDKNIKKLDRAVQKMLAHFPPSGTR
jgi:hypothetical protein